MFVVLFISDRKETCKTLGELKVQLQKIKRTTLYFEFFTQDTCEDEQNTMFPGELLAAQILSGV